MSRRMGVLVAGFGLGFGPVVAEPVAFVAMPPIAQYVAAAPRLQDASPASARINAALDQIDANNREIWDECGNIDTGDLSVEVTVDMAGPAFLGLSFRIGGYCPGAAHPFYAEDHRLFDLTTGDAVDLAALLPPMFQPVDDETTALPVAEATANAVYIQLLDAAGQIDPDCRDLFTEGYYSFDYWLNAQTRTLAMRPDWMPYAATACAEAAYIPLANLPGLGVDARIVSALEHAEPVPEF